MKKFVSILLTISLLATLVSTTVFANTTETEETNQPYITMAINEPVVISDGDWIETTPPLLVFGKTYVDLYAMAPLFGVSVYWMEENTGYFKVKSGEDFVDFTLISQWSDLVNLKHKYFVKDSKIYVSLRELADFAGLDITYTNGLIKVGRQESLFDGLYSQIYIYNSDDYVYTAYPCWAEYVVNPYQEYSYETMLKNAKELKNMYPELIQTSSIGKSVENRDLLLIKFGRGSNKIFVCGTHHAREYISTTYLMYAIDRYAYAYRNNMQWGKYNPKAILDNVTFYIVPMVNPDGVNLVQNGVDATLHADEIRNMKIYESPQYGYDAWKANIRGVDLNWNYDKDWTIEKNKNPRGSTGFNGDRPHTEPETIAVTEYVDNNYFDAYMSFHTQGQIFYWADNPADPSCVHIAVENDTGFDPYPDNGQGVGGSFFDYVYRNFKKPTITVELCPYVGNYPYPNNDFDTVWKPAKNVLLVVANEIIYRKSLK